MSKVNLTTKRVGHKGADLITPGNTLASFDAALDAGVDMVEFDVLPERADGTGELLLAHDYSDLARRRETALTLAEGLDHLCHESWSAVELDVDMKLPGYEDRVVAALRERGLIERTLVSTMETESLPVVRALEPGLRLGWSVPKVRRDYLKHPLTRPFALAMIQRLRRTIPRVTAKAIREGRIDAVMSHWSIVTPRMQRAITEAGGELYVWTVDDPARIERLFALGVAGVISNDPRLLNGSRTSPR
jgi:glycerophosphoryl diester phosphodiesterase